MTPKCKNEKSIYAFLLLRHVTDKHMVGGAQRFVLLVDSVMYNCTVFFVHYSTRKTFI